jgi:hypothetical protein
MARLGRSSGGGKTRGKTNSFSPTPNSHISTTSITRRRGRRRRRITKNVQWLR